MGSQELNHILPGKTVGPYRIVRGFKGRGGMARIFEVEVRKKYQQPDLPHRLALKVAKEDYQDALVAEADFLRRFDHPNVVRIYPLAGYHKPVYAARERFPFGWGWYYTMELLTGGSLERHLTRPTTGMLLSSDNQNRRRLGLLETLGVARQIAAALAHIHKQYVINLDVKPGNILFRRRRFRFLRGSVPHTVLCDFGISRDLRYPRTGQLGVATPEYISPEQASELGRRHQQVDVRSDIFSLGIMLYEMLTGTLPFENIALAADPAYAPAPARQLRPSIPPALEKIIMQAMAKDPNYRFQTAAKMQEALEQVSTPLDWKAGARYTLVGLGMTACLAAGGFGASRLISTTPSPTPTSSPPTATAIAPTVPKDTPASATPTQSAPPTSTQKPTYTPTNTLPPPTPTPTTSGGD